MNTPLRHQPPQPGSMVHAWGLSARKLTLARHFLPQHTLQRLRRADALPPGAVLALWGATPVPVGVPAGTPIWRLEDGFLRSVGLGADLVRPRSWVIDRSGIYFDPAAACDLETLLVEARFDEPLKARAAALRQAIVGARLTKYNVGDADWQRPAGLPAGQSIVLVPGQVESDASIVCGAGRVRSNIELLRAVRADRPDAWLVYKPHPDLLAGLRSGRPIDAAIRACCDEIVVDSPMATLLERVDEVHVMTSLAGFEALLRGKPVTTHGTPFYAGWGLTRDLDLQAEAAARRQPRQLDELVAAALILYPTYIDEHGRPATPESVLAELRRARERGAAGLPWWRRTVRPLLGMAAKWRGG
ncbi:beta-3-deoxy-D-manno-oct-2-ulosonic acid transferase [Piscinibacter sakaiensis]|uniref:capsular polysaccharide export protein, LipB/KpsS family n=1 Tax=Piscinibacter sakaiensis TaxID=1547922 RepID=UPI003AAA927B